MAEGYFGTVYPFKPSFVDDGDYTDLVTTSTAGGTGKTLSIRVSGNGVPSKVTFSSLAWVGASQQAYTTNLSLPSSLGGYSGTNLTISVVFLNSGGTPVSDTNNKFDSSSFVGTGRNYRSGETITFNDGVVSGTATIDQIKEPQFSVIGVSADGQDYSDEDTVIVPKSEFLRVQPAAYYEGANLGIPFFKYKQAEGTDEGKVLNVEYQNQGFETPYKEGIYNSLATTGGSGTGLTVDLIIVGNGGALTNIAEKSGWGIPANASEIKAPVPVSISGGSGSGASIYVGLRKLIENSDDKVNPDYGYGFYTAGVANGGSGYNSSDELTIPRANLIAAGFSLNAFHVDEPLFIRGVTTPDLTMQVRQPGSGYVNGEVVSISPSTLTNAGITPSGGNRSLNFNVKTLNFYGYPGVPSRSYTSYGHLGISLGQITKTTQWDARDGVLSEVTTWTTGNAGRPLAPESSGAPIIPTKEGTQTILIRSNAYDETLDGAGPFVQQESMPIPLYLNEADVASTVDEYSRYLKRFMLGDFYGTSIQEGVRKEVYEGWTPHMPFRYVDPFNNKISAMRMDATSWTVDNTGAVFSTNGIWIGDSNGTLNISPNVQGIENAPTPGFSDTTGLPYPTRNVSGTSGGGAGSTLTTNITVNGETYVDLGDYAEVINVYERATIEIEMIIQKAGQVTDFPVQNVFNNITMVVYLRGEVVTAGDTIDATNSGGIPAAQGDTLLTDGFTYVIEDVFATA